MAFYMLKKLGREHACTLSYGASWRTEVRYGRGRPSCLDRPVEDVVHIHYLLIIRFSILYTILAWVGLKTMTFRLACAC